MITVAGIFPSLITAGGAIENLRSIGITNERLILLSPGTADEEVEEIVPVAESGGTGAGEKIGSAVGRGIGIAGGIMLGGVVGSVFVPGVGAVLAAGVLAAALLGTGGAAIGGAAGSALDERMAENLRHDELHLYEAALRQGRSVLVALATDEKEAKATREALADAGAESIDDARENWWIGLRAAEKEGYEREGRDFALDETLYQQGFEAALHPRARGRTLTEAAGFLREHVGEDHQTEAFRYGYERGQAYQQRLMKRFQARAAK